MKRIKIFAAMSLPLLMLACSDDDTGNAIPVNNGEIRFTAMTSSRSRSAEITTNTLNSFRVFAYTDGQLYMDNVTVTKSSSDNTWTYSPVMYWPTTPVNFFAYSPDDWNKGISDADSPVTYTNDGNSDLVYAVNINEVQSASPVSMNFHHAFSSVKVMLKSTTENILVSVSGVTLANILKTGTFKFPKTDTKPAVATSAGVWTALTDPGDYVYFSGDKPIVLSATETDYSNECSGFLLPQNLTAMNQTSDGYSGSYIRVDCTIADKASGKLIWPNDNTPANQKETSAAGDVTGHLFFSLSNSDLAHWVGGSKYVYVITINGGAGMEPIEFSPEVKVYVDGETVNQQS